MFFEQLKVGFLEDELQKSDFDRSFFMKSGTLFMFVIFCWSKWRRTYNKITSLGYKRKVSRMFQLRNEGTL